MKQLLQKIEAAARNSDVQGTWAIATFAMLLVDWIEVMWEGKDPQDSALKPIAEWGLSRIRAEGLMADSRAQGTNLAGLFIGVMVAVIIGVQVAIPVINDAINNSNVSGTTALVLGLIPMFIGLLLLISLASPLMRRV